MSSRTERIRFPSASGAELAARLEHPDGEPDAYALFAHCFTCSKDLKAAVRISRSLASAGIAVLRFDFTGLGESEGDFADTTFTSNVEDLVAAADWLRENHCAPELLVGHSLGGAAVVAAASRIQESKAVATIGAPASTKHLAARLETQAPAVRERGQAEIELAGRKFLIKRQLLDDLDGDRMRAALEDLGRAIVVFHSPTDSIVGVENARRIYEAAKHPKSFVSLAGADHLLTRSEDAEYVGSVLAAWARRYLGAAERQEPVVKEGVVVVRGAEGLRQEIRAGRHLLAADEPRAVGGEDRGPPPYDLLLAALGACTSMTLRMYANRKKWPLESVEVELRHDKIHAKDCEDCETREGKIDRIRRSIAIRGELDREQRERLLQIADLCPVHKTLRGETQIETEEER